MAKYCREFKLKVVLEYLFGKLGYILLSQKYEISSSTSIKQWVRAYKEFGLEGLDRKTGKEIYILFSLKWMYYTL